MDTETFYVRIRGAERGPYSRSQLTSQVASGQLTGVHFVSSDRQTWFPAKQLDWLFTPTVTRPPPSPWPAAEAAGGAAARSPAAGPATRLGAAAPPPMPAARAGATQVGATRTGATQVGLAPAVPPPPPPTTAGSPTRIAARPAGGAASATARAVFVSHSSRDAGAANELVAALEAAGITCWIAPRDIPAGSKWDQGIMSGLQGCRLLLLLCSRHSADSDYVQNEVVQAVNRSVGIVPVRLDHTEPSDGLKLKIARYQWIDASLPPVSRHLDAVVAGVQVALGLAQTAARDRAGAERYVGPYTLVRPLGEGGMGTVYEAFQREPVKRTVALKLIKAGFDTAEVIARFASERQALARMNHPNIARVLDAGTEQGRPYFVMEYVPGRPITEFADAERLPVRARLELFLQVCDAIAHAHAKSIIHRDIKAGNVLAYLADGRPTAKVIDFGIAKALTGDRLTDRTLNTDLGRAVGTYASMAPEQAEGSPDVDTRADVYSLGVLLYELLTGIKPFDPESLNKVSDLEVRRIIRETEPPRPSARLTTMGPALTGPLAAARQSRPDALARALKGELEWIPMMAMRKERQRRYASPLLLAEDIQNYLHARPLMAGPESKVYRLRKFVRRNRALVAGGAVVVVATIVFIAGLSAAWAKARRQEQIAQTVNQFLLDIINRADPKQGNKHSLADAIGDSERLLNSRQARERLPPEVQAAMKDTIGNAQRALGDYKAARTNLEAALKLRQQILSSDDPDIARTLDHLGHLTKDEFVENKDPLAFEAAKAQYDQAIVILEKSLSKDDLEVAAALANRASLFYEANKLAEADADCRRAMDIRDRRDAPPDDRLQSRGALVDVLRKRAEADPANRDRLFKEADELIRDAEQIAEGSDDLKAKSANPSPNRARLLTQKGKLLQAEGQFGEAIKAFEEAVKIDEQVLEPGHPYIAKAKKWLKEAQEAAEKKPAAATEEPGKPRRPRPNGPPGRPR